MLRYPKHPLSPIPKERTRLEGRRGGWYSLPYSVPLQTPTPPGRAAGASSTSTRSPPCTTRASQAPKPQASLALYQRLTPLSLYPADPNTTWKGGWRWFDEHTLASSCCKPLEAIHQEGITLDEFAALGRCHGAAVNVFRPIEGLPPLHVSRPGEAAGSAHTFREAVRSACSDSKPPHLVVSFLRTALSQTGTGHFSPVAAYHAPSDSALVLDIARFKLPPYWVPIRHLYDAMLPHDAATGLPRGYVLLGGAPQLAGAERNMAQLGGGGGRCPVHAIKRQYCPVGLHARTCTDVKACHPRRQASQAGRVIRAAAEAGSAPAIAAAAGECGAPV